MDRSSHRLRGAVSVLVGMLALGLPCAGFGAERGGASQPSAIERLIRQEDARASELARFEAIASRNARPSGAATTASVAAPRDDEFAWGAAVLGVGAGVAAMCVLLASVTLVRGRGRLRRA